MDQNDIKLRKVYRTNEDGYIALEDQQNLLVFGKHLNKTEVRNKRKQFDDSELYSLIWEDKYCFPVSEAVELLRQKKLPCSFYGYEKKEARDRSRNVGLFSMLH